MPTGGQGPVRLMVLDGVQGTDAHDAMTKEHQSLSRTSHPLWKFAGSIILGALAVSAVDMLRSGDAYWSSGNKIARAGQALGAVLAPALIAALGAGLGKLIQRRLSFWAVWSIIYTALLLTGLVLTLSRAA